MLKQSVSQSVNLPVIYSATHKYFLLSHRVYATNTDYEYKLLFLLLSIFVFVCIYYNKFFLILFLILFKKKKKIICGLKLWLALCLGFTLFSVPYSCASNYFLSTCTIYMQRLSRNCAIILYMFSFLSFIWKLHLFFRINYYLITSIRP